MGNNLPKGCKTTLNDLKHKCVDGDITLECVIAVAKQFARNVNSDGEASVGTVFSKCISSSCLSTVKCTCTQKPFLDFCKNVANAVVEYGKSLGTEALRLSVGKIASKLSENAANPTIKKFFAEVSERATATEGKQALNIIKGTAGAAVDEVAETALSKASLSAKSALKWGVVVEGVCLAYTVYNLKRKLDKKEITGRQFRKALIKRTGGATGSVTGGTAGTFIGTLMLPGVGSVIGGFVGGVAGDYLGSWMGNEVDEAL